MTETAHAPALRLSELLEAVQPIALVNADFNPPITSIANDSRRVADGTLFVAIPGTKADGHRYIPAALKAGAAAVVCEWAPEETAGRPVIVVADARRALSALGGPLLRQPIPSACA